MIIYAYLIASRIPPGWVGALGRDESRERLDSREGKGRRRNAKEEEGTNKKEGNGGGRKDEEEEGRRKKEDGSARSASSVRSAGFLSTLPRQPVVKCCR